MKKERVIALFKTLARSQGFYGRLLATIEEAEANGIDLSDFFARFADCKSEVDVILAVEG